MSQQINLLPQPSNEAGPALVALTVWTVLIVVLASIWGLNQFRISAIQERTTLAEKELKELQLSVDERLSKRGSDLLAELEALRPIAAAAEQILTQSVALGTTQGYGAHFSLLSGIAEDGLWLTEISLRDSGKNLTVGGMSLNRESIMRFSSRLNDAFAKEGAKVSQIDLTPQTIGKSENANTLTATRFTLR